MLRCVLMSRIDWKDGRERRSANGARVRISPQDLGGAASTQAEVTTRHEHAVARATQAYHALGDGQENVKVCVSVSVCVCVCVYVCMHVHVCICIYMYTVCISNYSI